MNDLLCNSVLFPPDFYLPINGFWIATKLCNIIFSTFFQTKLVYPNGVKVHAKLLKQIETTSSAASFDRFFINTQFMIFFTDKYILKQAKKGLSREVVLLKFRESKRYETMQSIYEYRVVCDGKGGIKERLRLFKNVFRIKFNNWWSVNSRKFAA